MLDVAKKIICYFKKVSFHWPCCTTGDFLLFNLNCQYLKEDKEYLHA